VCVGCVSLLVHHAGKQQLKTAGLHAAGVITSDSGTAVSWNGCGPVLWLTCFLLLLLLVQFSLLPLTFRGISYGFPSRPRRVLTRDAVWTSIAVMCL
jgi:hypothetical protein